MALTSTEIGAALLYPNMGWSGSQITFSVPGVGATWPGYGAGDEQDVAGYGLLTATQANQFAAAIAAWDDVLAVSFVRTNDAADPGQIRIAFTDVDKLAEEDLWGYAYTPPDAGAATQTWNGDIWVDMAYKASTFAPTSYDFESMLHEIGHTLGLKHPFEDGATLPAEFDTSRYTVMSYTPYAERFFLNIEATATGIQTAPRSINASTPMVLDIAAAQQRYGADPNTAAGDTSYSWSQATPILKTIYDAGGVDTLDFSSHSRPSYIDLTPGAYSTIAYYSAAEQAANWKAQYAWASAFLDEQFAKPGLYTWTNNLGIAYGTVVENVVAGAGYDTILGNDAANNIAGRLGNDTLDGAGGDDYLRGDEGADSLSGGAGFDDINGNMGDDTARGGGGVDWVVGGKDNDVLYGDDGNDIVYGNLGNDVNVGGDGDDLIRGGQGEDSLSGGAGADWMSGDRGADTLSGGAGADIFNTFVGAGLDRVLDFSVSEGDRVRVEGGSTYTVSQTGADTVIELGGGDQIILVGVAASSLAGASIFAG